MSLKSGQAVTVLFTTHAAATGAATDATGTPTGTLYVNGTANGATVTVTNITTGVYKAAVTLPSLTAGDGCDIRIAATVSGVAGEGIIWSGVADTKRVSELVDLSAAAVNAEVDTAISDAALATASAVSTLSGYVDTEVAAILAAVDTEVAAIKAKTDNLPTDPADQSAVEAAITAATSPLATASAVADLPTNAELATALSTADDATLAAIAALNNLSAAQVNAEVDTAINDAALATAAALAALNNLSAQQVWEYATRTVTANTNLNDPTAAAIADAVLDELLAGHTNAGSLSKAIIDVLADTDELQGNQGNWLTADVSALATAASVAALNDISAADVLAAIEAATIDGTITRLQKERIELAVLAGKSTGGGTATVTFRDAADSKARVTATVDSSGNRTSVTVDGA